MVASGQVYLLVVTGMALVALAAAIPVLLRIVVDGRERWREDPTAGGRDERPALDHDAARCPRCGTENDAGFDYCRACAEQL